VARTTDAREKALRTAEHLFRVQGYAATGLAQIIEDSGSPKGSFYFHFPGGKRQLALETLAVYRARTTAGFEALAKHAGSNSDRFVRAIAKAVADEMATSTWASGCLAQNLAQELAPEDAEVADALAGLFEGWVAVIVKAFGSRATQASRRRAMALVAALEGARTLARTMRSAAPFDAVVEQFSETRR
jgi:AcrR family transcriptional regulator